MKISEDTAAWMRAALDGKTVQWRNKNVQPSIWHNAEDFNRDAVFLTQPDVYYVRVKPDVIVVNGIEVPAGVTKAPAEGDLFYTASPGHPDWISPAHWYGDENQELRLARGLVYTDRTACELRSKAMAAHMPG